MKNLLDNLLSLRWFALLAKEFRQIRRNRRLMMILVVPPTVNVILFGFALDPTVTNLRLGVIDQSSSKESRELVSAMIESRSFQVSKYYFSIGEMGWDLGAGNLDAGLVIPENFADRRAKGKTAEVQIVVDAVNSNTATIAGAYAARIIAALNQQILREQPRNKSSASVLLPAPIVGAIASTAADISTSSDGVPPAIVPAPSIPEFTVMPAAKQPNILQRVALLYNPGLENSWFIVTGLIGALLVIQGSVVAAASMVKEKEIGTAEQLLMTPAEAGEIITAKIAPIFVLLTFDIALALTVARIVFDVPVRGSFLLFWFSGALCVLSGIGIGTLIATFVNSQQQAQLMGFFVNPPIVLLSGATTPIEAMPQWLQPLTLLNPVRHFAVISRGILLKGTGVEVLYPNLLALLAFCILLVGFSAWRFRKQLR